MDTKEKKVLISPRSESICQRESPLGFPKQPRQLQQQLALCSLNLPRHVPSHAHCCLKNCADKSCKIWTWSNKQSRLSVNHAFQCLWLKIIRHQDNSGAENGKNDGDDVSNGDKKLPVGI